MVELFIFRKSRAALFAATAWMICMFGFGCSGVDDTEDPGTAVKGTVTDSVSTDPLAGAEIFVDDTLESQPWYVTDSTGTYAVGALGRADWTIHCCVDGYAAKSTHVKGEGVIENVDFEMVLR